MRKTPRKLHNFPALDHVKYKQARGKWYAYFNTGKKNATGNPIYARLPHPSEPRFYESYAAFKAGRAKREAKGQYTVADLIRDYEQSSEFKNGLSPNTRSNYGTQLAKIGDYLGHFAADQLTDEAVQLLLDSKGWGVATQNLIIAVLRAMYWWGRQPTRKKATIEPMRDYKAQKTGEHDPWPRDILKAGLEAEDALTRLAVNLLYYTGQRIGDVLKMRWTNIEDGLIYVRQQKTKKELWLPIHSALQTELDQTPKRGFTIICDEDGKPVHIKRMRGILQAFTAKLGMKTVPHGLRKNAVNALLEAGCTVAEVAAITGQTLQIIEHYAAQVNRKKMGRAAILKWEKRA